MKRKLKIAGLIVLGLILLFIITGVIIGTVYQDEVKGVVMKELRKNLSRDIKVDDADVHFSLFSKFPDASVEINNITVPGIKKGAPNLLKVKKLYLLFDMFSVFTSNFEVDAIDVQDGELNVGYEENDKANFYIWKESAEENPDEESNVQINLTMINLDNVLFSYFNEDAESKYSFLLEKIDLYPVFNENNISFASEGNLMLKKLKNDDFLFEKDIEIDHHLKGGFFYFDTDLFKIREMELDLDGKILVSSNGSIQDKKDGLHFDFKAETETVNVEDLLTLFPASYLEEITPLKPGGETSLKIAITNKSDVVRSPDVKIEFASKDLSFLLPEDDITLDNLQIKGHYFYNGESLINPHFISIKEYLMKFGDSYIKGEIELSELKNPYIRLKGEADVLLEDLHNKIKIAKVEDMSGRTHTTFNFQGKLADIFIEKDLKYLQLFKSDGEISFSNVNVKLLEDPNQYKEIRGKISFNNRDFMVDSIAGFANSTDFMIQGKVPDVFLFLLGQSKFKMTASVHSNQFNMNEFLSESESSSDDDYKLTFPENTELGLKFDIGKFIFRKFEASDVKGSATLADQVLNLPEFTCKTSDGKAKVSGSIAIESANKIVFECNGNLEKINVKKLFSQFENFSQDFIMDKHIEGILSSDIHFKAESDSALNIDMAKMYTLAHVKIENGKLIEFPSMLELDEFLSKEYKMKFNDLGNLSFSTLENDIKIEKRVIVIPNMVIKSSALNLEISGEHTFDMAIDYHFKIKSSELMKAYKSKKKRDNEFVEEEEDISETIPFYMKGTTDNPEFGYDKAVRKDLAKTKMEKEKEKFKEAFKKEFGSKKEEKKEEKKDDKKQVEDNSRFDVQWDDN
ncbi:MAG: AsmA family protein [Bacteroidetes bacterium]|nr:AsmA family protein [Bacteroidota bacterium]